MKVTILSAKVLKNLKVELEIRNKGLFINEGLDIEFKNSDDEVLTSMFIVKEINLLENTVILEEGSKNLCRNKEYYSKLKFDNYNNSYKATLLGDQTNSRLKL